MHAPETTSATRTAGVAHLFDHVVVGIDETPESLVAAAQSRVLRAPAGRLVLLAVAERYLAAHAGLAAPDAGDKLAADTTAALERARELVDADDSRLASGRLVEALRAECKRDGATLLAVGARRHRRLPATTFGGHDAELLHEAACAVLLARPGWGPSKPERVIVGVDGSPGSRAAESTARSLAAALGAEVVPVVSLCDNVDLATLRAERDDGLLDPRDLVHAVAAAASERSLVVVSRASRQVERIAYSAGCSVLVLPAGT